MKTQEKAKLSATFFQYRTTGLPNFPQKSIQQAPDNEKFQGLQEKLATERESARLLPLSVRNAGAWLSAPRIATLGLQMTPNELFKIQVGCLCLRSRNEVPVP